MKSFGWALILSIMCTLVGCGTAPTYKAYQGAKELSCIARIQTDSTDHRIAIRKIDGKATVGFFSFYRYVPDEARVLPGRHFVELLAGARGCYAKGKLSFDAEAGHIYIVRWKAEAYKAVFWIEEKDSGRIVSGR